MLRVAQIVTATGYVQAVVRPTGVLIQPTGMTFVEISDELEDEPVGKYYVNGQFQDEPP
jgi:hypothetical protein